MTVWTRLENALKTLLVWIVAIIGAVGFGIFMAEVIWDNYREEAMEILAYSHVSEREVEPKPLPDCPRPAVMVAGQEIVEPC